MSTVAPLRVSDAEASTVTETPLTVMLEPASTLYCWALSLPLPVVSWV